MTSTTNTIIPGLYGLDSTTAFKLLQKDPQKYINNFTKSDKQLQTEADYFTKKLATYKTPDDLFKDTRAMNYLMEAYGLGTETDSLGLIKKALTQDPTATDSLVNQLADSRYKTMATALRMDKGLDGLKGLVKDGTIQTNYIQNEFEEALGQQDNALREAAYFARSANSISSVYTVLGDKALRDVITKTLSLPDQLAIQDVDTQAAAVAKKVDITKFADTTSASSVTATQLANATSDHTAIGNDLDISDAATSQVKMIQNIISQLETNYSTLSTITDPNGGNASTIAIQQNAVPQLVGLNQMVNAGGSAVSSIASYITSLQNLVTQAGKSGSDLTSLKQSFAGYVDAINETINNASIVNPDGNSQNILLNGSADAVITTYNADGDSVTVNRYDYTGIQNLINDAATAFNAATDSTDSTDLNTALSRLLRGQDQNNATATQLSKDQASLTNIGTPKQLQPYNNQMSAGANAVDSISGYLSTLQGLLTQAGQSGSDLTTIQKQFATVITSINDALKGAEITNADGTKSNILLNGSADSVSTKYIVNGTTTTVTMNRYDLTSLQSLLTTATTALGKVTSSTDKTDLNAAISSIESAVNQTNKTATQIASDQTNLANVGTSSGFFAASLNTASLTKGQSSVDDALDRVGKVADLLNSIADLADQASQLDDSADHTDVENQFNTYKTQLQNLLDNTGTAGLDNLLNSTSTMNYEIINGKTITVNAMDLKSQLSAVLSGSISDSASANDLFVHAIQGTNNTDRATRLLNTPKTTLDSTINTYDPQGKLNSQVAQLQDQLSTLISRATDAVSGKNLLSSTQKNITLSVGSTGTTLSFRSVPTFQSSITSALNDVMTQINSGGDVSSILSALGNADYISGSALRTLNSDNRVATIEYGKLGSTIDALDKKNTDASSSLYQTNTFTQKFIARFLATNGATSSNSTSYLSTLFNNDSSSALTNIFSLINQMKA